MTRDHEHGGMINDSSATPSSCSAPFQQWTTASVRCAAGMQARGCPHVENWRLACPRWLVVPAST
jgi:hypothetical protein